MQQKIEIADRCDAATTISCQLKCQCHYAPGPGSVLPMFDKDFFQSGFSLHLKPLLLLLKSRTTALLLDFCWLVKDNCYCLPV